MRLHEWQQKAALIKAAKDLFDKNETFRMMMEVAQDESPVHGLPTGTTSDHQDSCALGFIKGYHHLLDLFKAMRTQPFKPKDVQARFENQSE